MKAQDLKNSILQLAIQGKLVEQREEEGTAKELLDQIKTEKERLIKEGKIKKQKPLPEITEEEIPFDIPESWEWVRHNEFFEIIGGSQPPKSIFLDYEKEGYIRLFQIRDYGKKPSPVYVPKNKASKFTQKGDILLARYGASVGKVFFAEDGAYNVAMAKATRLFSSDLIVQKYLFFFYLAPLYQKLVRQNSRSAQAGFNKEDLNILLLPLPPLEEQKRIVAKTEELMPYIDQYDIAYSEVEALNKKFPEDMQKSILQYAIQGKLVEQKEEEGTAEELYQEIQKEKEKLIKEGKIKKQKPLPEITEEEIPFEIPESWKWVRLGDIFEINPRSDVSDGTTVSFIPMTLIEDGYRSEFTFEIRKWGEVKKGYTHFQEGDIVMAKITPCFQNLKSAVMEDLENGVGAGTTELHVLRCNWEIYSKFYLWFIKSPSFVGKSIKNMTGTAGQKRVPTDIVKNSLAPLPPLEEQKRIVEKIEELLPFAKTLVK